MVNGNKEQDIKNGVNLQKVGPVAPGFQRVTNYLSGNEFDEPVGSNYYTSARSETYWSS